MDKRAGKSEARWGTVSFCHRVLLYVHGNPGHRFRLIGKKTDYKSGIQNLKLDAFNSEECEYLPIHLYKLFILF